VAYFPEFRPMRDIILQNIRSDNDRPAVIMPLSPKASNLGE